MTWSVFLWVRGAGGCQRVTWLGTLARHLGLRRRRRDYASTRCLARIPSGVCRTLIWRMPGEFFGLGPGPEERVRTSLSHCVSTSFDFRRVQ